MSCPVCGADAMRTHAFGDVVLLRCSACGHRFTDQMALKRVEDYGPAWEEAHERWLAHPNLALFEAIARCVDAEGAGVSVVDIGAGNGAFLRFLQQRVPDAELTAIEPALTVGIPGVEVIKGDLDAVELRDRQWDVAVSLATVEHVSDVRHFAARLHEVVRPGGLAVVMTLDEASILYVIARLLRRLGWRAAFERLYDRQHLHHFTSSSLERLFEQEGFRVEAHLRTTAQVAAVDMPKRSAPLVAGIWLIFALGRLTGRTYLQTVLVRNG